MLLQDLVQKIIFCATEYYERGTSPVSDEEFDGLIDELRSTCPDHPLLNKTGWGYKIKDGVEHLYHEITGISHKYKDIEEVPTPGGDGSWTVMPKLDGSCVVLYYKDGVLQNSVTRGDGVQGRDVTKNIISRVPLNLNTRWLTGYVRCEVVVSKNNFKNHFPSGSSARNVATGLLGAKTPDPELLQYLDVIPVTLYNDHKKEFTLVGGTTWTEVVQNFPVKIKFQVVTEEFRTHLSKQTMEELSNNYLCDGLVVRTQTIDGSHQFAFKFDDEVKLTTVRFVEWNTQDTGKIFPTVHYSPTEISGCVATKASGKSHSFITENWIDAGAEIMLVRSGEVIPNIQSVVTRAQTMTAITCEHGCDPEYLQIDGAHIYCKSPKCPATVLGMFKRLIMTFAPKTFEENMLEAIMQRFNDNVFALLEELKKFERKEVMEIIVPGLTERGKRMVQSIFSKIAEWKLTLAQLTDIAVIECFGDAQSKLIESKARNEDDLNTWCKNANIILKDWTINSRATANWTAKHDVIKVLLEYFRLTLPCKKEIKTLRGIVCITGKIQSMSKKKFAEEYIESREGYKWTENLIEATILIDAEGKESNKIKQAKKKRIEIIPIKNWIKDKELR